jgi:hypothetical protein
MTAHEINLRRHDPFLIPATVEKELGAGDGGRPIHYSRLAAIALTSDAESKKNR